ncbi:MAG: chorismate mutase [Candidatus Krumholzibacteriia bacterium]
MNGFTPLDIDEAWRNEAPFNIYGPCSAESPEQLLQTAAGIHERFGKVIFRAGIWKPRTRPDSFEGVGREGLVWLREVRDRFGFQVTTEVASAQHVELCLEHGIDMVWIGARSTVNPFSVQEIAEALRGTGIPVFLKNPIHSDFSLWVGGLERLNKVGIRKLGAIHRGFYEWNSKPYRYSPRWELPIELKRKFDRLPIVCDISHIGGDPRLLPGLAQKALDLDFDGLMIETHVRPSEALSDARQQITPAELDGLVHGLIRRETSFDANDGLLALRREIDDLDDVALAAIAKRMQVVREIGRFKREHNVTILQVDRLREMIRRNVRNGEALGLDPDFVKQMLSLVHSEAVRQQNEIMNDEP